MLDKHSKLSSQNCSLESSLGAELNIKGLSFCFWRRSRGCEWAWGRVKLQAACALGLSLVVSELQILYNQILMMQSARVSSSSWILEWFSFTLEAGFGKHDSSFVAFGGNIVKSASSQCGVLWEEHINELLSIPQARERASCHLNLKITVDDTSACVIWVGSRVKVRVESLLFPCCVIHTRADWRSLCFIEPLRNQGAPLSSIHHEH